MKLNNNPTPSPDDLPPAPASSPRTMPNAAIEAAALQCVAEGNLVLVVYGYNDGTCPRCVFVGGQNAQVPGDGGGGAADMIVMAARATVALSDYIRSLCEGIGRDTGVGPAQVQNDIFTIAEMMKAQLAADPTSVDTVFRSMPTPKDNNP